MKLNVARTPINDFLNRHKLISLIVDSYLLLFFSTIRIVNRLFANGDGYVIVIALHKLGDTVFTLPAVKQIQKRFLKKTIIICFPESIPIYNLGIDEINFCALQHQDFYFGKRIAKIKAMKKLSSLKPYIIFDLTGQMNSASLIFNMRAKHIIGLTGRRFRAIYDQFVLFRKNPHLIDQYLDAITPIIPVPNRDDLKKQSTVFCTSGKVLIHPFAGWPAKEWNFNNYCKLAINLGRFYNVSLIVPVNKIANDILDELVLVGVDLIQSKSVESLIEQIKSCSIIISNDSGPVYIASLLSKPTISIYGPTNPEYSRPIGEHHYVITKTIKCSPEKNKQYCFTTAGMFGCPSFECMNLLNIDEVYDKVAPLIKTYCNLKNVTKNLIE